MTKQADRLDDVQVLAIAGAEFARRGFDGVSMRDLAVLCKTTTSLLYYRFASKEALYEEASHYELDLFIQSVNQRIASTGSGRRSLEQLAGAIFDTWIDNPNPLLLTSFDVVDAKCRQDRWLTENHYPRMVAMVRGLCRDHLQIEVSDDRCFAFLATVYGFGTMMIIDQRHWSRRSVPNPETEPEYIQKKRDLLIGCCTRLLADHPRRSD